MRFVTVLARFAVRIVVVALVLVLAGLAFRAFDIWRGPQLSLWHTYAPAELSIAELDRSDWAAYLAAEERLFTAVQANVSDKLPEAERTPLNRYFTDARNYPGRFPADWNRSFVIQPSGAPQGVAVLLHGLTDSPYSLRHFARLYADRGFVALGLRLPGHGTVPGALTDIKWEDWSAAVRLALREARQLAGPDKPVHLVGYSNGGALAVLHTLEAIAEPALVKPDQVVLVSPMIGITPFARFAGLAALPAYLPGFAAARWLDLMPEFNPFKYNSFPVNAAQQSYALTQAVQARMTALSGRLADFPAVLSFQSVVDHTVSTQAVINGLHMRLPSGRSELVLFDVNRGATLDFLLTEEAKGALRRLLPAAPRPFRSVVVATSAADTAQAEVQVVEAGGTSIARQLLPAPQAYPPTVYSLSHVAMPFPVSDGLYGIAPDPAEDFGIRLGDLVARGERGTFTVSEEVLMRIASNPFLPFMLDRVGQTLPAAGQSGAR
ncbi:alpha/beta hydrolase [Aquabacter cavernae]|uniref:alpha/beta hydrolase n=1 Tax=Aquabacter cavernae TaxID=2496029 RepID=UPI001FE213B2|nr:alpha/beta fold hydrolase [Aquabacter cavernae]